MEEIHPEIAMDDYLEAFGNYFKRNNRCMLSAKYGDGKTYFLSRFIEENSDKYLFITLHPVNYQVATNYDIFEYIKRDILLSLLMVEGVEIDDKVVKKSILLYNYFTKNHCENCLDLMGFLPDINILNLVTFNPKSFVDNLDKIKGKFKKDEDERNKDISEDFIKELGNHGIYEFDPISQLICDINDKYRETFKEKQTVLIIEDLDRIDPAHIFRILNVFSAQFDRENIRPEEYMKTHGSNKFKFDKIITVCDYDNIKSIYHHLYGEKTDFNGYISKFSSEPPFKYSLRQNLHQYIFDHVIDDELKPFDFICHALIDCIIDTGGEEKYNNMRNIIDNFLNSGNRTKECLLPLRSPMQLSFSKFKTSSYSSINTLTKFLEILKRFGIDYKDFNIYSKTHGFVNDSSNFQMINLIGICWSYLCDMNEKFELKERQSNDSNACDLTLCLDNFRHCDIRIRKISETQVEFLKISNINRMKEEILPKYMTPLIEHFYELINI